MIPSKVESGKFILLKLEELYFKNIESDKKLRALFRLFTLFWEELTQHEKLNFTTLFVRLAYASSSYPIQGSTLFLCHRFRRIMESSSWTSQESSIIFDLGVVALRNSLEEVLSLTSEVQDIIELKVHQDLLKKKYEVVKFYSNLRIVIMDVDIEGMSIDFIIEEEGLEIRKAYFDIEQKNELFNSIIINIKKLFNLPIVANLIDVELDENERYIPGAIVLLPDFLIDATAIAKIFHPTGVNAVSYLISKFIPTEPSDSLLMGNIANRFLDTLLYSPDFSFRDISKHIFSISPLQIAQFSDSKVSTLLKDAHNHYENIRESILSEFKDQGIETKNSYVEPSFLSNSVGFQGRLDLLHVNPKSKKTDIVELKSGSPFMANANGVSEAHYRQLMIYEMMIRNLGHSRIKPKNYILYSKLKENRLRYAGYGRAHQYEILKYRNLALFYEQLILNATTVKNDLFERFDPRKIDDRFRFDRRDAEKLYIAYKSLDHLEKTYIKEFTAFITREYHLGKTGEHGLDRSNGMAGLWLDPQDEKIEEFRILSKLIIEHNQASSEIPILKLAFSEYSNRLSRFRIGDIIIVYPDTIEAYASVDSQLFKATILELNEEGVSIRLRAPQMNNSMFHEFKYWNIESDFLDGSVTKMYKSLYRFMVLPREKRALILGRKAPRKYVIKEHIALPELSEEQNQIVNEIISCEDYYLLWGPPGTGKTSVIIKHLIKYYFENTDENILLLAYTNRAVDEMCSALTSINPDMQESYLRLGSRYSVDIRFRDNVLSNRLEEIESRAELNSLIQSKRIYISTVASMHSNRELFKVKKFSTVIIDEASQLLEPYIIDLLGEFDKFVLVGDHKQLPAVVIQSSSFTNTENVELKSMELSNLKNSLFERLYKISMNNNWHWSHGTLTHQGRMHQEIMDFVSHHYYEGKLKILPSIQRLTSPNDNLSDKPMFQHRMIFVDTPIDDTLTIKVNKFEAEIVVKLYKELSKNISKDNQKTIGVITPFRAQIANITSHLNEQKIDTNDLTIDTVERYQGGARDYIIISLTTNDRSVLSMISSKSDEGLDRKLNVAITRAKEQLIILGNKEILIKEPAYNKLIQNCKILSFQDFE